MRFTHKITNIWNTSIVSYEDRLYNIKNHGGNNIKVPAQGTSFNSFAAETVFHAYSTKAGSDICVVNNLFYPCNAKIFELIYYKAVYGSAVKADMGVKEENESGVIDSMYYDYDGSYVKEQREIWCDF